MGSPPSPQAKFASKPIISGKDGGHTLNLHEFARDGVTLVGRIEGARDHTIFLANLAHADQFEADFVMRIDEFIAKNDINASKETLPVVTDGYGVPEVPELNLNSANIPTVIWATGYSFAFSLVQPSHLR